MLRFLILLPPLQPSPFMVLPPHTSKPSPRRRREEEEEEEEDIIASMEALSIEEHKKKIVEDARLVALTGKVS